MASSYSSKAVLDDMYRQVYKDLYKDQTHYVMGAKPVHCASCGKLLKHQYGKPVTNMRCWDGCTPTKPEPVVVIDPELGEVAP